jgi:hypothetical protein
MIRRALLTLVLAASTIRTAAAQVLGIPVVNNGAPTGINIGADVGFSNADYGKGTAVGGRAAIGLGFFGISAGISRWQSSADGADAIWSPGGAATLRLLGGPLVPFRITMQAGVGHWSIGDVKFTHVPVSLGIAATIPNPAFAIKPWIAPRIDVLHNSGGNIITGTDTHFGISGGVDIVLLSGLMIRGAYDRTSGDGGHPTLISFGLGFSP